MACARCSTWLFPPCSGGSFAGPSFQQGCHLCSPQWPTCLFLFGSRFFSLSLKFSPARNSKTNGCVLVFHCWHQSPAAVALSQRPTCHRIQRSHWPRPLRHVQNAGESQQTIKELCQTTNQSARKFPNFLRNCLLKNCIQTNRCILRTSGSGVVTV